MFEANNGKPWQSHYKETYPLQKHTFYPLIFCYMLDILLTDEDINTLRTAGFSDREIYYENLSTLSQRGIAHLKSKLNFIPLFSSVC